MKRKNLIIGIFILLIIPITLISWPLEELKGNFLTSELHYIENHLDFRDRLDVNVSKAPIGWHLDHVLLVINGIYQRMDSSDVNQYKKEFNLSRSLVFTMNKIPRGRGESPKSVRPSDNISKEDILEHLTLAKKKVIQFDSLPENSFFEHPYFGLLNRKQAKKFVKIHTNHHLDIVKDILKKQD